MYVNIGGVTIQVKSCLDTFPQKELSRIFHGYISPPATPEIVMEIHGIKSGRERTDIPSLLEPVYEYFLDIYNKFPRESNPEKEALQDTLYLTSFLTLPSFREVLEQQGKGEFSIQITHGGVVIVDTVHNVAKYFLNLGSTPPLSRSLEAGLYFTCSILLPSFKGMILHGAGFHHKEAGYVFLAPSRGGKTTISRSLKGEGILADDGVVVRKLNGEFRVFGSPWRQNTWAETIKEDSYLHHYPLKAIFFLKKEGTPVKLAPGEAMGKTLLHFVQCLRYNTNHMCRLVFNLCGEIFSAIPAYTICFEEKKLSWEKVEYLLENRR
ncbi:MAG: hypothetical protein GXO71_00555 [Caldiserica bacterium]|nr:hypothetical protein [Caldisericota bacterium]